MQIKPRSYPHPVLAPFSNDIRGAQFQSTVAVRGVKNTYEFDVTMKTSSSDLVELVRTDRAKFVTHVECALTRYRALFPSTRERFSFQVPSSAIDGRVEVCSLIVAETDLPEYRNTGFHSDYEGLSFAVRKGDTLAVAHDVVFLAEKRTDPLRQIPSIFTIVPNEDPEAPAIEIDSTGPKVRIALSRESYDVYAFLRQDQALHTVLNSMIIVPALIAVLEEIKRIVGSADGLASLESRRWYGTISRRLKQMGIDFTSAENVTDSATALAQRLIGEPLHDGLRTLRSYEEGDDQEVA